MADMIITSLDELGYEDKELGVLNVDVDRSLPELSEIMVEEALVKVLATRFRCPVKSAGRLTMKFSKPMRASAYILVESEEEDYYLDIILNEA